ncbi:hypothetical protein FKM82_026290 [Ascaphus truei]
MQVSQISCLATAMTRYCTAARNMEHMVMFPSLLREIPMEQQEDSANFDSRDLYDNYIKLKTIRVSLENGVVPLDDWKMVGEAEAGGTGDSEALCYYHFTSLFRILSTLTKETNAVTGRYKELIGMVI